MTPCYFQNPILSHRQSRKISKYVHSLLFIKTPILCNATLKEEFCKSRAGKLNYITLQVEKAESMLPFILVASKQFRLKLLKANFSVKYESSRSSSY